MTTRRKLLLAAGATVLRAQPAQDVLRRIYEEARTPHKYGVIIRGNSKLMVDNPRVFRHDGKWLMHYISFNEVGYQSHLAESSDLLNWTTLGKILPFQRDGWDKWQANGAISLVDTTWGGSMAPEQFDGKYWLTYVGGALQGYETDPLSIGVAWTRALDKAVEWTRIPENPVLSRFQPDVREFEKVTLYRSTVIHDKAQSLGYPFLIYYNGKIKGGYEKIGMAVSKDMVHWKRYGADAIVANGEREQRGISGNPQIVRMGDVWVMFYFGAFWKPNAFDTFAASHDLVNWTKWEGPHLVEPSEPWDAKFAHKPWLVKHNGVVYHYYCAVGNEGRVIALATSRDLRSK